MGYDLSYLKTTPGKLKISCLAFGTVGLLAVNFPFPHSLYGHHFNLGGGIAFVVTLILLLSLILKASLRQSSLFRKIEIYIYITLIILYAIGSFEVSGTWNYSFYEFMNRSNMNSPGQAPYLYSYQLRELFGSFFAMICSILAIFTYAYDIIRKIRECESEIVLTPNV